MWELINANKRKSIILFILMWFCLLFLGYSIGRVFWHNLEGGITGIFVAIVVTLILSFVAYRSGDKILLSTSKAIEISDNKYNPQLFNVVEEMKISANLPVLPKIYIIPENAPNAFAVGLKPESSSIAVTAGLLSRLNRDELQGVIAHEMSHIINRDTQFMTLAGILLGSITLISEVFFRGMLYSRSSRRYSSKSEGQGNQIILVIAIIFIILSPIMAQLLYFSLSRKREYLADASAVRLTRYPEGLASALEKISQNTEELENVNKITAPMYIVNPLFKAGKSLTSTHPPIEERIKILRSMNSGAGYSIYQDAYSKIKENTSGIIPNSCLAEKENINIRSASEEKEISSINKKADMRKIGDIIMTANNFTFLTCECGLKIKIPPEFKKQSMNCPRCNRENKIS